MEGNFYGLILNTVLSIVWRQKEKLQIVIFTIVYVRDYIQT
jgi:hypothetical protein